MKTKIPAELQELSPFFHDINLGQGYNTSPDSIRMIQAENLMFMPLVKYNGGDLRGKRILDLGCNCGGFSFLAHKYGAEEVIGIDSRAHHIKQANAIKDYIKAENVKFYQYNIENLTEKDFGIFDLCIMSGIIYHLSDPINIMNKISQITSDSILIDSHVHYSNDQNEDIPSWWMLPDTDENDMEGLYKDHPFLNEERYLNFEKENKIDYSSLRNQFIPSPQTEKDFLFMSKIEQKSDILHQDKSLHSDNIRQLSLVPNKKALIKLLRSVGFEDILTVEPHRFSDESYNKKIRLALIASKRENNCATYLPVIS